MPRITPVRWKKLVCVFEKLGFKHVRSTGSHYIMTKEGVSRPVVIPMHSKDLTQGIIKSCLRTACIDNEKYFELLEDC